MRLVLQRKVSAANESTSGGLEPRIARMCSDEIDADESLYAMRPHPSYPCHPWFDISLLWLVSCRWSSRSTQRRRISVCVMRDRGKRGKGMISIVILCEGGGRFPGQELAGGEGCAMQAWERRKKSMADLEQKAPEKTEVGTDLCCLCSVPFSAGAVNCKRQGQASAPHESRTSDDACSHAPTVAQPFDGPLQILELRRRIGGIEWGVLWRALGSAGRASVRCQELTPTASSSL